ncbi:MAG TPA: DUF2442 domain-containing protein [Thermoanaerobaculia bacterium]|jgi:hypothetical protein
MGILAIRADERVRDVYFSDDSFTVELMDGRAITTPLTWFPRLLHASSEQRQNWQISGAGYGIHWPDIDEDLSTEGLLRGAPASRSSLVGA